jgi:GYF domain 2
MNYFISRAEQQYGPYTLADLQRYVASGDILVTDLTRSEAITEWLPVSQVIGNIPVPFLGPSRAADPTLIRDDKKLVVIRGATLPPYCVKCAKPADSPPWEKNYTWHNPLLALLLFLGLIGLIIYIPIYYSRRKQMMLVVPLCIEHWRARRTKLWVGTVLLVTSPLLLIFGVMTDKDYVSGIGFLVLLGMLTAGTVVLFMAAPLRAKKIDDQQGVFVGAREPFLQVIDSHGQQQTTGIAY